MSDKTETTIAEMVKQIQLGHQMYCAGYYPEREHWEWMTWNTALQQLLTMAQPTPEAPDQSALGVEYQKFSLYQALRDCTWAYRDSDGDKRAPMCIATQARFTQVLESLIRAVQQQKL